MSVRLRDGTLGILAIRAGRARARSIAGLALSGVAFLFNLFFTAVFIITLATPGAFEGLVGIAADNRPDSSETDAADIEIETVTLDTPCYSFASPAGYINNQSAEATAACTTNAELWGEYNTDGTVNNTGVGTILGGVTVQAIGTEGTALPPCSPGSPATSPPRRPRPSWCSGPRMPIRPQAPRCSSS